MLLKILLSGNGGQGIQTIANLITQATFDNDFYVSDIPNYGLEQRGGVSLAFIQISDKEIGYPKFSKPDILLIMSDQARERTKQYVGKIVDILDIQDYKKILEKNNIKLQSQNIFFLGLLVNILEKKGMVTTEKIYNLLNKKLSNKPGWDENKTAFEAGNLIHNT